MSASAGQRSVRRRAAPAARRGRAPWWSYAALGLLPLLIQLVVPVVRGLPVGNPTETEASPAAAEEAGGITANIMPGKTGSFIHAFTASFAVMIVSELGDKTFFIAAVMAMTHSRMVVFAGAMTALGLMTVLSAYLGFAVQVFPRVYTHYISTALFAIFGLKMLKEAHEMSPDDAAEELEEVSAELKAKDEELERKEREQGMSALGCVSAIYVQALTMTFLAEWGDRSQIATIILGAREDVFGVSIGGVLGHSVCTFIAVSGGRLVAQKISVKTVTYVGGVVFLLFALTNLLLEA